MSGVGKACPIISRIVSTWGRIGSRSVKTGAAFFFFHWDFGASPAKDVILLPPPAPIFSFSVRCLAIALALLFWSADKNPSVSHHVPPSRTGHGTANRDESPFTGQHWQAASPANFRFCRLWQSPGGYCILRALHRH